MRGNDDVWGAGNPIVVRVPANKTTAKLSALRDNIVHHLRCSPNLKEYTVAQHHFP